MTKKISNYEERIVLFLDILGFKELIKKSVEDSEKFQKIQTCIKVIRNVFNITQRTKERTITQFSDSLVVSFKITEKGEVALLLNKTKELIRKLILKEIVCRGGIAKSKLIHNDIFLYGPAFNEAYKLESKLAIFPRVIIADKSIIDIGVKNYGYHPSNDPEYEESEINSLIKLDFDGFYYVDYFSSKSYLSLPIEDKNYINILRKLIDHQLDTFKTDDYKWQKYEWMKDKFNERIAAIKSHIKIEAGGLILESNKNTKFYKKIKPIE